MQVQPGVLMHIVCMSSNVTVGPLGFFLSLLSVPLYLAKVCHEPAGEEGFSQCFCLPNRKWGVPRIHHAFREILITEVS